MNYADLKATLATKVVTESLWVDQKLQRIVEDPYKIASSYTLFEAIAKVKVYRDCVHVMETATEAEFQRWLMEQVVQRARNMEQSTSPTSNLFADYERAAWARVATGNSFNL